MSLLGLAVAEAQYRVDRGAYFEKEDQQQTIKFSAEQSDLGKKHFDVSATLKLTSGGEKDETVLSIAVTYLMHLHTKEPILEEHVKEIYLQGGEVNYMALPPRIRHQRLRQDVYSPYLLTASR